MVKWVGVKNSEAVVTNERRYGMRTKFSPIHLFVLSRKLVDKNTKR